jgi:hypothetical protein
MPDDPEFLSVDFMRSASRSEALRALSIGLADLAWTRIQRERSFMERNGGGADPDVVREVRILEAARALTDAYLAYSLGAALEVAAANKRDGKRDYHRMPPVLLATADQMIARFCAPIDFHDKGVTSDVK